MQQTMPRPQIELSPNNTGKTQPQKLIVMAVALFALSGLLVGFTVGALNRPALSAQTTPTVRSSPVVAHKPATTQTPQVDVMQVGIACPQINTYQVDETADNTTSYQFSTQIVQPVDQKGDCGKGKPLFAPDVMCKLWLTKDDNTNNTLNHHIDRLRNVDMLSQPMPNEEQNALIFTDTQQTRNCSMTGATTWNYHLSANLEPGTYFLVVLADWKGQRFNWTTRLINIHHAG